MLDALTLDQIRTFVAVAESGSFRAGAGTLARAQSGVSVAVANLEEQLGVLLFDRSGHRPVLTAEGKTLLGDARNILLRVDAMRARARGFGAGVELELAIVVDTLFPLAVVGKALTEMREIYPSVAINLLQKPLGGPLQALLDRDCTVAVVVGEDFRDPRITYKALAGISLVAVVAPDHPLAIRQGGNSIDVPDMADHLQIVLSDPTSRSEGRDFGVLSPQTCRVNSQDAKHSLIVAGVGWGRLPHWQVEDDLTTGRLMRLETNLLGRNSEVVSESYIARRLDEPMGPAATAFCEALLPMASNMIQCGLSDLSVDEA